MSYKNFFIISVLLFIASALSGGILNGTVKDKNGIPKKYMRVDINPGGIVVYTDKSGKFSKHLKDEKYTIRVNEFNRFMLFHITVKGKTNKSLILKW